MADFTSNVRPAFKDLKGADANTVAGIDTVAVKLNTSNDFSGSFLTPVSKWKCVPPMAKYPRWACSDEELPGMLADGPNQETKRDVETASEISIMKKGADMI